MIYVFKIFIQVVGHCQFRPFILIIIIYYSFLILVQISAHSNKN
jgi:hypothetical protein